ncbi:MAG: RpiB/LacA/LacB family sugar-phosphate isomerase [Bacteroides sp.]
MKVVNQFDELIIGLASDHAGVEHKRFVREALLESGYVVDDCGTNDPDISVDYPLYAHPLAHKILTHQVALGVAFCGTGNGMAITLNRHPGVRAALCWNTELASLARRHNNANAIALPARFMSPEKALELVRIFLTTPFDGQRHDVRVHLIEVSNYDRHKRRDEVNCRNM